MCILVMPAYAADTDWRGETLSGYINQLAEQGVRVIYSDGLVTDDLRLLDEPSGGDPIESLVSALRPHGLTLVAGPGDNWLVVRDPDAKPPPVDVDGVEEPILTDKQEAALSIKLLLGQSISALDRRFDDKAEINLNTVRDMLESANSLIKDLV